MLVSKLSLIRLGEDMADITVDPLRNFVLDNAKFFYDSAENWLDRYSHPLRTVNGDEPSTYLPDSSGLSGKLVFDWVPYIVENFPEPYFPVFPNGEGVWVREVHVVTGTALDRFDINAKIKSDTLVLEWTSDHGKTVTPYALVKVDVPSALSVNDFYDQLTSKFLQGSDQITGSRGKDIVDGFAGNDTLNGLEGNDHLAGGLGDDYLVGGAGVDVAKFSGAIAEYTISKQSSDSLSVTDTTSARDGIDSLAGIERLKFSDTSLALDVGKGENAGSIYRLYEAAFDRAPKPFGEGYWLNKLDHGESLVEIANQFLVTQEFKSIYGESPSNTLYVTTLFEHVLGRAPKQAGLDYYSGELEHGRSRAEVLVEISESAENVNNLEMLIVNGIRYQEVG